MPNFKFLLLLFIFILKSIAANAASPTITSTEITTATEDSIYSYVLSATDTDNDSLTWTSNTLPSWLSLGQGSNSTTDFGDSITGPGGVAIDDDGNVYVVGLSGTTIFKITPSGTQSSFATVASSSKYGMLVIGNTLYVAYYNLNKITKIDLNDPGAGESDYIASITDPLAMIKKDGYIYVAQYSANKISKIDLSDDSVSDYVTGTPYPFGIGFSSNGDLYIASYNNKYISKFSSNVLTANIKSFGSSLSDVKIDDNDNIYVSSFGSGVKKISSDLSSVQDISTTGRVWGMTINSAGTLIWGIYDLNKVVKLETGAVLSGTPTNDDVGVHDVNITLSDGGNDIAHNFQVTVTNTNDAPTDISLSSNNVNQSTTTIDVGTLSTTDMDPGANSFTYTLETTGTSDNGTCGADTGNNTFEINSDTLRSKASATEGDYEVCIQSHDGTTSYQKTFTITVNNDDIDGDGMSNDFENLNGLDPLDPSDATGDLDGDGVTNLEEFTADSNPLSDDYGPILTLESSITIDAVALLTSLPNNLASAIDALDGTSTVAHDLNSELLAPGRHVINWSSQDAAGNTTTSTQTLNIRPLANWQVDQSAAEGNTTSVTIYLNGDAPEYPVVANYTVSGSAGNPGDHNAVSGALTITEGQSALVDVSIVTDLLGEEDETIIFTLDSITNAAQGVKNTHTITISELNHAPQLSLSAALHSSPNTKRSLFAITDGMVTITAAIDDVDSGDEHSLIWDDKNNLNGIANGTAYTFDPSAFGAGIYQLLVTATDQAINPKSGTAVITLIIESQERTLSTSTDSDGDGIMDSTEGTADADNDNVPDYLDNTNESNLLAIFPLGTEPSEGAWFVESQSGLKLQLNIYSSRSGDFSPLLNVAGIVDENDVDQSDTGWVYEGGIYDFIVSGIATPGEMALIVFPQLQSIPENAVYRKEIDGQWFDYVQDANNTIHSAPGSLGTCPPPGSDDYASGLTVGHYCVQLGIADGGMNDADGAANGTIIDPGGVATESGDIITELEARPTVVTTSSGAINLPFLVFITLSMMWHISRRKSFKLDKECEHEQH
ncbi:MAG: hypothetical protein ACI935_002978 [Moritella dasanensis]|jgi:hypothetical protein